MVECSKLLQYPSELKTVRTIFHQTDVYIKYKTIPPSKYKQFKFIISVHTIFNPSSEQPRHGAIAGIRDGQGSRESTADSGPDMYALMLCFMMFKCFNLKFGHLSAETFNNDGL